MLRKAAASGADEVMLDLEDAIAPWAKEAAGGKIVEAIDEFDWSGKVVAVRIFGLDTRYAYGDLVEVVEGAGEAIDSIIVPKVGRAADVYVVETLLAGIEENVGIERPIGIEVLIEETEAVQNITAIAEASDRLEALIFGPGDYSAAQGVNIQRIGQGGDYPGDIWHYVRSSIVISARSNGLDAIDGPYADFSDPDGYREECVRSNTLGFVGEWAIHPSQIEIANEEYAPTTDEVVYAERVVEAMGPASTRRWVPSSSTAR